MLFFEFKRGVSRFIFISEELIICIRERLCGYLIVEKVYDFIVDNRFFFKG